MKRTWQKKHKNKKAAKKAANRSLLKKSIEKFTLTFSEKIATAMANTLWCVIVLVTAYLIIHYVCPTFNIFDWLAEQEISEILVDILKAALNTLLKL